MPGPPHALRTLPWLDGDGYYQDSAHARPQLPRLQGALRSEACVVGAGITGLSAALELARCGVGVTLLEARRIGAGASGRNGGQALADFACGIEALERRLGADAAARAWELSCRGIERLRQRIARHAICCDWDDGVLTLARSAQQARRLYRALQHRRTRYHAGELQWVEGGELRAMVDSTRYCGAMLDPGAGHLHPLNYALGLARAAQAAGVRMHEHSMALRVQREPNAWMVHCTHGVVRCRLLLLATGAVPGAPVPRLQRRVLPVASCMLATEPLPRPVLHGVRAAHDSGPACDYYRLSADGRLLFGTGAFFAGALLHDSARRRAMLRRAMLRCFPQLDDVGITHEWGGWIDASANRAPDFGHLGPGAVYLQGFSGHGLALSGLAGELGARALRAGRGHCADFELFARLRHASLPSQGVLRIPIGVLGALWGRLLHTF